MSKGYSLAGLRLGYGIGSPRLIAPMLSKTKDLYNVDVVSQKVRRGGSAPPGGSGRKLGDRPRGADPYGAGTVGERVLLCALAGQLPACVGDPTGPGKGEAAVARPGGRGNLRQMVRSG